MLTSSPHVVWSRLGALSLVGSAFLIVLLVGGSGTHNKADSSGYPQIHPHKPVHLGRVFDVLTHGRYGDAMVNAQQAWDDVVGENLIAYLFSFTGSEVLDAIFVDLPPNGGTTITHNAHNGNSDTYSFSYDCGNPCSYATVYTVTPIVDQTFEPFKIGAINQNDGAPDMDNRNVQRLFTHEMGHVLGLGDHDRLGSPEPYHGMMDSTCSALGCEDDPGDYEILNFTFELFPELPILALYPDEASCVRELFNIAGKQACLD